ncbi:HPr family phosphocarrier protein [Rubrobacter taiwanensis]|uniref:Phosphocarrier protein HPr n=1 Tax=Rubrobacter taiwanensis TaxID=185139 RepID=A0A4R1BN74_9ACTN|nr:HPr family phosphocarrier protein [Rubrobacter taiwanensis]TCJ18901.1 HPr family phosphocarrier protein [Rubrobacter taiwanensis]
MVERETRVGPEEGLHARPAARFVKTARRFSSEIVVVKDGREANAKSSLKVMTLGAKKGDRVIIRAEGEDARQAVDALVELISADEHEPQEDA